MSEAYVLLRRHFSIRKNKNKSVLLIVITPSTIESRCRRMLPGIMGFDQAFFFFDSKLGMKSAMVEQIGKSEE